MMRSNFALFALLSPGLFAPAAQADDLYFAEITPGLTNGHVSRIKTDGSGYEQVIEVGDGIRAIAFDPVERRMYWTDVNNYVITRAGLDGSGREDVVTFLIFPSALTIDPVARSMYWLDQDYWLATSGLDGSNYAVLNETTTHRGVALDAATAKVYWSTSDTMLKGKILKSNLDGTGVQVVVTSADSEFKPSAIALDLAGGKIYWTDYTVDVLRRSNIDGTNIEIIWSAGANHNPRGIALDLENGKVYWGQDNDFDGTSSRIMRANLDGTSAEIVINGIGWPNYLAFVPPCPADFDENGFVTGDDYDAFVVAFEAGDAAADFNRDTFVTGDDFDGYVAAFEAGC